MKLKIEPGEEPIMVEMILECCSQVGGWWCGSLCS
jgi:hypothetical protein